MGGDPAGDHVEAPIRERERLGCADDVGAHARRRVAGGDGAARRGQPPADVPAARRDIERGHARAGLAPLDEGVEVVALAMCGARGYASARSSQASLTQASLPVTTGRAAGSVHKHALVHTGV